ncbi:centromere protein F-like isoform X1 [Chrysemys picta bellii]|uniref:centromere protein F-like isoform X1 n=1 Tax=Chrysemys picta bellii TaxID=8478 RepID=UPI0032B1C502
MRSLVLYDKSLSQKIELEAQEAELQHLKNNNKLLQDSVQELQLENGTLKKMNKALEEEKLDNLKSTIQRKKQNGFARSKMKTWMKSCKQLEKGKKMLEKQIAEHGAPLKEQKPSMG